MNSRPVVVIDAEWGYRGGRIGFESAWVPIVLCALVLLTGQEFFFLPGRDALRLRAFLADHREALFVSHSAMAEMKYLIRLGMSVPERWYDTLVAERWLTNRPAPQLKVGLAAALERRNMEGYVWSDKSEFRDKILHMDYQSDNPKIMGEIIDYCLRDCRGCAALFVDQTHNPEDRAKLERLMSWYRRYLLAASKMELRGIPIDTATHNQITKHWPKMRESLAAEINVVAPGIMNPSGLDRDETRAWFKRKGYPLPSQFDRDAGKRKFSISNEALKEVEYLDAFIVTMRQTQKTLVAMRNNKLIIDTETGRHYFDVMPVGTITGRNAPKGFIFGMAKWFRFLIVPESLEHVLVYVDYNAQEIGIAAALSGDPAMVAMYQSDDPHLYFANLAGAVPNQARKEDYPEVRKKYKTVNLGVMYGLTPKGTARKLGIALREAEKLHREHRRLFPVFWAWSERKVVTAFTRGSIRTRLGWRAFVPPDSNERTWANWPMQASGGDIMRLTVMYMDDAGLALLAPIHDGFLLSCRRDEIGVMRKKVDYACASAVEHVLPGFKLKWSVEIHEERFDDPDGLPLWNTVQGFLQDIDRG